MKTNNDILKIIKANRKGSREAELEISNGWSNKIKIHKSKKNYNRKTKHKNYEI
jgi:hypothetical protein